MKVNGLDNRVYPWRLTNHVPLNNDSVERSSYHILARELLRTLYPLDRILEELPLPGSYGLTVDFYVPVHKLMVEVHGKQHYEFTPYFHTNIMGFWASKKRDKDKRSWAELNNLYLVELPYNESTEQWRERICSRRNTEDRQNA